MDAEKPLHLRSFTAGWRLIRTIEVGIEALQRDTSAKLCTAGESDDAGAKEAVETLERVLLDQTVYCTHHRGSWIDRLALLYERYYLKDRGRALQVLTDALCNEQHLRSYHQLALQMRYDRLLAYQLRRKVHLAASPFLRRTYKEAPKIFIDASMMPADAGHSVFVEKDEAGNESLLRVEQLALAHFRRDGYPFGLHAEGSVIRTLIGLLYWDIIFLHTPKERSVFRSKYQSAPLDLFTGEQAYFFSARCDEISARSNEISAQWNAEQLAEHARSIWEHHFGCVNGLVQWDLFESADELLGFLSAFDQCQLTRLAEYILTDPRGRSSGFPDLVCWRTGDNDDKAHLKIVEVKGPNDHLSEKQIVWLDVLLGFDFDASVLHVRNTGRRGGQRRPLRATSSASTSALTALACSITGTEDDSNSGQVHGNCEPSKRSRLSEPHAKKAKSESTPTESSAPREVGASRHFSRPLAPAKSSSSTVVSSHSTNYQADDEDDDIIVLN